MEKDLVVIGIGNPMLKDDRAGIQVAELLEKEGLPIHVEVLYSVGFEVLDKLLGYNRAIVVDACQLGKEPGTILELSVEDIFATHFLANSHAVTLGSTLKSGTLLFEDEMPKDVKVILIEAEDVTEFSNTCSPVVEKAVNEVVERIRQAC